MEVVGGLQVQMGLTVAAEHTGGGVEECPLGLVGQRAVAADPEQHVLAPDEAGHVAGLGLPSRAGRPVRLVEHRHPMRLHAVALDLSVPRQTRLQKLALAGPKITERPRGGAFEEMHAVIVPISRCRQPPVPAP